MSNPILDATRFRRDLPEAARLEKELANTYFDRDEARNLAQKVGMLPAELDVTGPPSTFWQRILDTAAKKPGGVQKLIDMVDEAAVNQSLRDAIDAVRKVTITGSLQISRLLLDGKRPFLGRQNLRSVLPELRTWKGAAAVLVVRGAPDTGRTETQFLVADHNQDRQVLLDENLPLKSTMRAIWRMAGAAGEAPVPSAEPLTTESALLMDFWTDVHEALETHDRRLWVLFDDLDKGPGRVEVRALAEVLAIRLRDVVFQRRLRLVLLGYPDPQLPQKVQATLVRNDTTEELDTSHVQAFLDFCLTTANKKFDPETLPARATELCASARAQVTEIRPFHEALHGVLTAWHRSEIG